jgi:malate synthase
VLFVVGQASKQDGKQMLEAIFDLTRAEAVKRVQAGTLSLAALAAHDYVFDIFAEGGKQMAPSKGNAAD